jgi:hypothetical protein
MCSGAARELREAQGRKSCISLLSEETCRSEQGKKVCGRS